MVALIEARARGPEPLHYPILNGDLELDFERPMFGIVEAVCAGRSMSDVTDDMAAILRSLSQFMRKWRPD